MNITCTLIIGSTHCILPYPPKDCPLGPDCFMKVKLDWLWRRYSDWIPDDPAWASPVKHSLSRHSMLPPPKPPDVACSSQRLCDLGGPCFHIRHTHCLAARVVWIFTLPRNIILAHKADLKSDFISLACRLRPLCAANRAICTGPIRQVSLFLLILELLVFNPLPEISSDYDSWMSLCEDLDFIIWAMFTFSVNILKPLYRNYFTNVYTMWLSMLWYRSRYGGVIIFNVAPLKLLKTYTLMTYYDLELIAFYIWGMFFNYGLLDLIFSTAFHMSQNQFALPCWLLDYIARSAASFHVSIYYLHDFAFYVQWYCWLHFVPARSHYAVFTTALWIYFSLCNPSLLCSLCLIGVLSLVLFCLFTMFLLYIFNYITIIMRVYLFMGSSHGLRLVSLNDSLDLDWGSSPWNMMFMAFWGSICDLNLCCCTISHEWKGSLYLLDSHYWKCWLTLTVCYGFFGMRFILLTADQISLLYFMVSTTLGLRLTSWIADVTKTKVYNSHFAFNSEWGFYPWILLNYNPHDLERLFGWNETWKLLSSADIEWVLHPWFSSWFLLIVCSLSYRMGFNPLNVDPVSLFTPCTWFISLIYCALTVCSLSYRMGLGPLNAFLGLTILSFSLQILTFHRVITHVRFIDVGFLLESYGLSIVCKCLCKEVFWNYINGIQYQKLLSHEDP